MENIEVAAKKKNTTASAYLTQSKRSLRSSTEMRGNSQKFLLSSFATLTSPLSTVIDDYINHLDYLDDMIPPININFITPYVVLNINKSMPNKAPGHDKITVNMLKKSLFKIILQIYYIIRSSVQLGYFPKV